MLKKMDPIQLVHEPWQELSRDNDIIWNLNDADKYCHGIDRDYNHLQSPLQ